VTVSVLDSSAVLAVIRGETGQDVVVAALRRGAVMSAVNLAEVATWYARNGASKNTISIAASKLGVTLTPFDDELAIEAGLLQPLTRLKGLSLGDRSCLALARRLGAPALTSDRKWAEVADAVGVQVELIR
jgi:PIN domain nuclease of toxin-antitoxin system